MKKQVSICLTAVLVLLSLAVPAYADIIIEPDNSFYIRHQNECTALQRSYYANGPEGFVTLWDAPNGTGVAAQYENGEVLRVFCLYSDWGFIFTDFINSDCGGWVPMEQMELVYDYISFEEDYGDQFRDYAGEFIDYASQPLTRTVFISTWEYPGAPEPNGALSTRYPDIENMLQAPDCFDAVFTDENGLDWGFKSGKYNDFWICLDDPAGTEFPVRAIPQVELVPPQTPVMPSVSYVPYALVGGVVLVTAGLLVVFYWRKKKNF